MNKILFNTLVAAHVWITSVYCDAFELPGILHAIFTIEGCYHDATTHI